MSNKPDLFVVLALVVGIGVIASSLAQGITLNTPEKHAAQLVTANPVVKSASPAFIVRN